jgi:hypothetical protein
MLQVTAEALWSRRRKKLIWHCWYRRNDRPLQTALTYSHQLFSLLTWSKRPFTSRQSRVPIHNKQPCGTKCWDGPKYESNSLGEIKLYVHTKMRIVIAWALFVSVFARHSDKLILGQWSIELKTEKLTHSCYYFLCLEKLNIYFKKNPTQFVFKSFKVTQQVNWHHGFLTFLIALAATNCTWATSPMQVDKTDHEQEYLVDTQLIDDIFYP